MKRSQSKQSIPKISHYWLMNKRILKHIFLICMFITALLFYSIKSYAVEINENTEHISVSIDVEVPVQSFSSSKSDKNDYILVWIPSESGILDQEKLLAKQLAKSGTEVWLADLHAGWFVGKDRSSINKFKPDLLANLLDAIIEKTGKKIYLISNSHGVIAALRAAHGWQEKFPKKNKDPSQAKIAGAILLSGQFYSRTPEPGFDGIFNTIVHKTRLRIILLQPNKSPWFWKLAAVKKALEKAGSKVDTWILKGVRDRYYYRTDSTEVENKKSKQLAKTIHTSLSMLESDDSTIPTSSAVTNDQHQVATITVKKYQNRGLSRWRGKADTPTLNLKSLNGEQVNLLSYKGKVVLINFWASWCPPCVHEMPSMQALEDSLKSKGFHILAINMAEKKRVIQEFIKNKVKVSFKILLDSNGAALKKWKVYAFPTSYLLGKKGKIRYAVYGAIDWNSNKVHKISNQLLSE
ncbi:hypothetical protein MNBD_GAMMA12-1507 [hydrothermal vent metagenome]|uniref:Thioredoxin domain-containing protein n=1 Tax=hydrothermal vent metagenome TaxID=652676 RepID=A0A3B0Z1H2_9ZZZZ